MPLLLLNRLSRPKEGETPQEVLATGRTILLETMRPVLCPEGKEGEDWIYYEDILSRILAHQEGEILHKTMQLMEMGRCSGLAVTEMPRLTGDLEASAKVIRLCKTWRIPLYTHARLGYPYKAWEPESEQEMIVQLLLSSIEVTTYRARVHRAQQSAYPLDATTGLPHSQRVQRAKNLEGAGRHINGAVPDGYVWDKVKKEPVPDTSIPCPTYIPPGKTNPPAYTKFEIIQRARQLGLLHGNTRASKILEEETGYRIHETRFFVLWSNPFYAGRPTCFNEVRGGKLARRDQPIATQGDYPTMGTWEEHLALKEAMHDRRNVRTKSHGGCWASHLLRCECGSPWIGGGGGSYYCRNYLYWCRYQTILHARGPFPEGTTPTHFAKLETEWKRTSACGCIQKDRVHAALTPEVLSVLKRRELFERYRTYMEALASGRQERQALFREEEALLEERARVTKSLERLLDLYLDERLGKDEYSRRREELDTSLHALKARSERIRAMLAAPTFTGPEIALLENLFSYGADLEEYWADTKACSDTERNLLCQTLIDYVPITPQGRTRIVGPPVWKAWVPTG